MQKAQQKRKEKKSDKKRYLLKSGLFDMMLKFYRSSNYPSIFAVQFYNRFSNEYDGCQHDETERSD